MRGTVELPDVHDVVLVLQYCSWKKEARKRGREKGGREGKRREGERS